MKSGILISVLTLSLILLPSISLAVIPTPNPGGIFSTVDLTGVLVNIINFIVAFIALLGIIFIIWGALQYLTSAGDEGRAEDAKMTITYAALGLFIAAMAYAIEDLVLNKLLS